MSKDRWKDERRKGRKYGSGLTSCIGLSLYNRGLRGRYNKVISQLFRPSHTGYAHVQNI